MNTQTVKTVIDKKKSHAFGKDVYLLGADAEGIFYWLEAPSWDCDWYWGFGYVETYKRNVNPSVAKDIDGHEHIDSSFTGKVNGGKYIHNIFDSPRFASTTFTEKEGWELSELFKQFYFLKDAAANFGRGSCHISSTSFKWEDKDLAHKINQQLIPKVTARIIEILSPH